MEKITAEDLRSVGEDFFNPSEVEEGRREAAQESFNRLLSGGIKDYLSDLKDGDPIRGELLLAAIKKRLGILPRPFQTVLGPAISLRK